MPTIQTQLQNTRIQTHLLHRNQPKSNGQSIQGKQKHKYIQIVIGKFLIHSTQQIFSPNPLQAFLPLPIHFTIDFHHRTIIHTTQHIFLTCHTELHKYSEM